jgi:multiple sugar transport system substrate-binding protein
MKKKLFCLVFAMALVITPMFAQGSSEKSGSEKIKLTFVETMTSPSRTEEIQSLIDEYVSMNPNIEIELISPPYEQADNKLTMMLNSNQALDIVEVRDHTLKQYVNNSKLVDLSDYMSTWEGTSDLLPLTLTAAKTVDDTPYMIPQFFFVKGLFVRTDILDKYGIEIPTTIEELYAAAKEITSMGPNQYGFGFRGKSSAFKISDILMLSDLDNIDLENIYKTTDGEFAYNTPEGKASIEAYVQMFKDSVPSDGINWGFNEQVNAFISGTTPFLVQDPDTISMVDAALDRDQYTVVPMPVGKSGKTYLDYGFAGLGIPTTSEHPQEAWDFISYMLSAENNAKFCKTYGPLPINTSTYENDEYFSQGAYKSWQTEMSSTDKYVFVKYPLDSPKYPGWAQVEEQTMQSLLLDSITTDELIAQWTEYWSE